VSERIEPATTDIENRARAWARGIYPTEAGTELLIRLGGIVRPRAPWLIDGRDITAIDAEVLLEHSGAFSGGQRRAVSFACSLIAGEPIDLSDAVSGVDRRTAELMVAAVAHASGSHEHSDVQITEGRLQATPLPSLHPWPADGSAQPAELEAR